MRKPERLFGTLATAALALTLTTTAGTAHQAAKKGPSRAARAAVEAFLASETQYHLATLDDYSAEVKASAGNEPIELESIVEADATGDRVKDVAALVVATRDGKPAYGVVAFRGLGRGFGPPQWIARDSAQAIAGVVLNEGDRPSYNIYPPELFLYEEFYTEPSKTFRWNGTEFEENYYVVGERLGVFEGVELRAAPRVDAPSVAKLPPESEVIVIAAAPKAGDGTRWFRVKTPAEKGKPSRIGFAPGPSLSKGNG